MRFGCLSVVPQQASAHDFFGFTLGTGRQFECSFGKLIRRPRGATATPIREAAADVQVAPQTLNSFSMERHRLQMLSLR